tara:strand:- start:465 stop:854 length:390 start_codon:yes stop_codon:yes gene_type:complete
LSDWIEGTQDKIDLLRAQVNHEVRLRGEAGHEGRFYVVDVYADSTDEVKLEGHFSIPRWRSLVAWSSCSLLLVMLLTSPVAVVAALKLNCWALLLPYPAVVPLYMLSVALFSPRCLLSVGSIQAVQAMD